MAFCTKCGKEIGNNDHFCNSCGSPQFNNSQAINSNTVPQKQKKINGCLLALLIFLGICFFIPVLIAVILPVVDTSAPTNNTNHVEDISTKFQGDCSVSITNAKVYDNIIGYPELKATFTNLSDKNISAIELYFVPKDVYGEERTNWMSQNKLITDNILYAGKKDTRNWSFIDNIVKNGDLYLYSVYYEDGTSWGDRNATKDTILKYGKKIEVKFER